MQINSTTPTPLTAQKWPNPQETADLVLLTEEILNRKLDFFVQWLVRRFLLTINVTVPPDIHFPNGKDRIISNENALGNAMI